MTDNSSEEPIEVEGEVIKRIRPADLYFARPAETKEQYETRMERERKFIELQKELLRNLVGEELAKTATDYYEVGAPSGLFGLLGGKHVIEDLFVQTKVLGETLMDKIECYCIEVPKGGIGKDKAMRALYFKHVHDFNPDVLYSAFIYPAAIKQDGTNLFVLEKNALEPGDRAGIVHRANNLLNILEYSEEYYYYKHRLNPWKDLIIKIQDVSLRVEPMQDVEYGKTGRVIRWTKPTKYHYGGMIVESPDVEMRPILMDCVNKKKFGHLQDKLVRYHFHGYDDVGFPYGKMVSTTLTVPIDDTLKLTSPEDKSK